ncbi:hypothetical protein DLAC_11546 [Tieghemostelium lacteum]|uniref:Uncharacterized protein n=1 Tax=Tieghemostelium lacteum TaxID=361077 RepID=A0A152A1R6_TIELA|nr:hypothetical protein DLAC_11546 [Tieghemostelium lacteum]|eukprot:KYR00139.1 hypothetical protein DLAC_11546 [Tieghemostelium lacteum]
MEELLKDINSSPYDPVLELVCRNTDQVKLNSTDGITNYTDWFNTIGTNCNITCISQPQTNCLTTLSNPMEHNQNRSPQINDNPYNYNNNNNNNNITSLTSYNELIDDGIQNGGSPQKKHKKNSDPNKCVIQQYLTLVTTRDSQTPDISNQSTIKNIEPMQITTSNVWTTQGTETFYIFCNDILNQQSSPSTAFDSETQDTKTIPNQSTNENMEPNQYTTTNVSTTQGTETCDNDMINQQPSPLTTFDSETRDTETTPTIEKNGTSSVGSLEVSETQDIVPISNTVSTETTHTIEQNEISSVASQNQDIQNSYRVIVKHIPNCSVQTRALDPIILEILGPKPDNANIKYVVTMSVSDGFLIENATSESYTNQVRFEKTKVIRENGNPRLTHYKLFFFLNVYIKTKVKQNLSNNNNNVCDEEIITQIPMPGPILVTSIKYYDHSNDPPKSIIDSREAEFIQVLIDTKEKSDSKKKSGYKKKAGTKENTIKEQRLILFSDYFKKGDTELLNVKIVCGDKNETIVQKNIDFTYRGDLLANPPPGKGSISFKTNLVTNGKQKDFTYTVEYVNTKKPKHPINHF